MKTTGLFLTFILIMLHVSSMGQTSVMSYNIKYANENDGPNSWSLRKEHLTNQLKFYEPDIFGVQEALLEQLKHFKTELGKYDYSGAGRDDGKLKGEFSAIFFNIEKFEKIEEGTFWLSKTPEMPSKGWDAAYPRVCSYVKLKKKSSETAFWVFNCHLDHVGNVARKESVKLIYERMKELNKENLPAILMGDFNLEPETEGIEFLNEKLTDSKEVANLVFGPEGTFNGYEFDKAVDRRIDYIFLNSEDIEVLKYAVLSDSKDLKYPSDHLPVFILLHLEKPENKLNGKK